MKISILFTFVWCSDICNDFSDYGFASYELCMKDFEVKTTIRATSKVTSKATIKATSDIPVTIGQCIDYLDLGFTTMQGMFTFFEYI